MSAPSNNPKRGFEDEPTELWFSPRVRIGEYRILRKLGEGGMGAVFEAIHERIGRRVAIKVLHPQHCEDTEVVHRFLDEARAANQVQHSGIVAIFEVGQIEEKQPYLVMEYLEGENLAQRIQRQRGPLGADALRLGAQIAETLRVAHLKGVIHRDLKPENVFLVPDPLVPGGERTKLLDFGLAKVHLLCDETSSSKPRTRTGLISGTPLYMSPEQCRGLARAGEMTDVYALGVMLYEMLSGRPPFVASGFGESLMMQLSAPPPPLRQANPEVPWQVARLVHRMLEKDPLVRPSMGEVAAELVRLEAARKSSESLPSSGQMELPLIGRPRRGELLLGSLVAVLTALLTIVLSLPHPPHPLRLDSSLPDPCEAVVWNVPRVVHIPRVMRRPVSAPAPRREKGRTATSGKKKGAGQRDPSILLRTRISAMRAAPSTIDTAIDLTDSALMV